MCGFVGIFCPQGPRSLDAGVLTRMNDRIAHRGPDGAGIHLAGGIALGHRRLAIIDVGGGAQPMYNEDRSVVVVFNGEIYNFQDLVGELEAAGHVFQSHCDTEVILHGWEQWGEGCLSRFQGMFAFALWDEGRQTLFLARDHLGKKPLYYARAADGSLVFGSELKAILVHPGIDRQLDPLAVEDYFALGYVPDPRSIYRSVRKLPPAHFLLWRRGEAEARIEPYWDLRPAQGTPHEMAEASAELITRLREATATRLISDVPIGAFLSGGVDSSAVVALMAGMTDQPVKTFSIAFNDREYDESAYAERIAVRYGTDHHVSHVSPDDMDLVDHLADVYDEPFGDSSAIPTYRVCELARTGVTVALSGDGGDEVFAGYRRYRLHMNAEKVRAALPLALRRPLFGALGALYPKLDWAPRWLRAKTTFQELAVDGCEAYCHAVSVLNESQRSRLFSPALKRDLQGYRAAESLRAHMDRCDSDDMLQKIQYADFKSWLPGAILVKVDRASMANSLEVRAPLLDYRLAEWGLGLASSLKITANEGKAVLKKAVEPYVDQDLLYRPKRGFSMPLARWFRGPLSQRILGLGKNSRLAASGLFACDEIDRLAQQHVSGQFDHSAGLWLLLMFEAFLEGNAVS